ncbi:hypothetical protein [Bacillus altitudinis]|uniref:hypothetical protein n=1 Tax=Bacillus altitudinis TaxID=293387 RepID=UPI00119D110D|nr:hypothetical protein [Bacillus altitudinis]
MAKVKYLMQGLSKRENHRNYLETLIGLEDANEIILSVAFLTSEGVYVLEESLKKNREKITFYVGCRNGVTSLQGIISLLNIGINPILVDTGSNNFIFHPKVFFAQSNNQALSTVGSANFTYGGLIKNLESSALLELDFSVIEDKVYVDDLLSTFNTLSSSFPENVFQIKTVDEAQLLFEEGRLINEKTSKVVVKGKSKGSKRVAPSMQLEHDHVNVPKREKTSLVGSKDDEKSETVIVQDKGLNLVEVWKSKELTKRDLNIQTGGKTNVTGSMLLKKGTYKVDQQVYFREKVFADLEWQPKEGKPSYFHYANATFYFIVEGVDFGSYLLEMKHDTRTNTKTYHQRQPMTHLFWGESRHLISNPHLLGKTLRLMKVRNSKSEFLLEIN